MSLALERIDIESCGGGMACVSSKVIDEPRPVKPAVAEVDEVRELEEEEERCSSSSTTTIAAASTASSSIGRNSDEDNGDVEEENEEEVQSAYKGGPLDMMESLEEVLPIRRGISKFYNGKSKSFTSLADASSANSMKDVAKAENAYARRRRNLLAFNHMWEKNRSFPYRNNGGGIAKRPISSSRSTLALAVAMSSSESISNTSEDSTSSPRSRSPPALPPLHPNSSYNNVAEWGSFSLADLRQCGTAGNPDMYRSSNTQTS